MKAFTGIKDVDLKIISQLEDHEIGKVCQANKYVSRLCEDESFWLNRLLTKHSKHEIKQLRGSLSYKDLYHYLYLGDFEEGALHAIKEDNVYLYKAIPINKYNKLSKFVMYAGSYDSIEILTYIFINSIDEDIKYKMIKYLLVTAGEKTVEWMAKMSLTRD